MHPSLTEVCMNAYDTIIISCCVIDIVNQLSFVSIVILSVMAIATLVTGLSLATSSYLQLSTVLLAKRLRVRALYVCMFVRKIR